MNVTPVFLELLLPDAEKLWSTRPLCYAQEVVDVLPHRRTAASTADDGCIVSESCAVQRCRHSGGASTNYTDFVFVLV